MVERSLMVRWVIRSILHGRTIVLFLVPASAPRLCNKGRGMYYLVCGMLHNKDPLLLIGKRSHIVATAGLLSRYLNVPS